MAQNSILDRFIERFTDNLVKNWTYEDLKDFDFDDFWTNYGSAVQLVLSTLPGLNPDKEDIKEVIEHAIENVTAVKGSVKSSMDAEKERVKQKAVEQRVKGNITGLADEFLYKQAKAGELNYNDSELMEAMRDWLTDFGMFIYTHQ